MPGFFSGTSEAWAAHEYDQCFTDSLGTLLSLGSIQRDKDGNVDPNQGLCAPNNLTPDNTSGPCNIDEQSCVIFRWRLAMSYQNALNILTQEADVNTTSP